MKEWLFAASLLSSGLPALQVDSSQVIEQLDVRAFRFYRAEGGETLVTGLIEIPYRLLTPSVDGRGALVGDVAVSVRDSAGLELHHSAWQISVPRVSQRPDAVVMEVVEFKLAAGHYDLQVTVHDSTGEPVTRSVPIAAFQAPPPASDVVLSPSMRLPAARDTNLLPGERRWSGVILTPAANMRLTPVRSRLYYMLEVYPDRDTTLTMTGQVLNDSDRVVVATATRKVAVTRGGSVLRGQVELMGLPAGHYRMSVRLEEQGRVEERSEGFTMADFAETMETEKVRLAAARETDAGYFGLMNEDQLDEAEGPLTYLTTSDTLSVWKSGLSLSAKRQFLIRFWAQRDPTPGTVRNEAREAFYQRIAVANRRYAEGGRSKTPGWRTDRGRIAIVNGDPTEQLDRRISSGTAPPYLVWRHQRGKERYYIFADRTGFGVYKLIASNDLKETGLPGFREILGAEALQDISRWLGIDLFQGDHTSNSPN